MEKDGILRGCGGINFSDDGHTGKLCWDIFDPAYQGKGLGSRLTRYRTDRLKADDNIRTISVRTSQLAFAFYEKQGFILKETAKNYWADGFDLLLYGIRCRH